MRDGKIEPRPDFQRRLVWSNKDKSRFIDTILKTLPFPEIYVAAGDVNVETGEAKELLVDGQQRVTTLYQYFTASEDLRLDGVSPYAELDKTEKEAFLQYDVVVRDLGRVDLGEIREVFERINATSYSLNAMEVHNARYEGALKNTAESVSQHPFFEDHRTFSASEIRRMLDTRYCLILITTVLSTYYNRDDDIEEFLGRYNDSFPHSDEIKAGFEKVFALVNDMSFPPDCRVWKKADLFTLLVELYWITNRDNITINTRESSVNLQKFYESVDAYGSQKNIQLSSTDKASNYHKAALQGSTDRGSRLLRGEIIRNVILPAGQTFELRLSVD